MDQNHILMVSPRELLRQPNVVDPQAAINPSVPILFYKENHNFNVQQKAKPISQETGSKSTVKPHTF